MKTTKVLLIAVFALASGLSIKAGYDLAENSDIFPAWFVPSFIFGITILIALSLYFVSQTQRTEPHASLLTGWQSGYLWTLMTISFICTTSVHGFYPFHANAFATLPAVDLVMKINYAIGIAGFLGCTALASIYIFGRRKLPAMAGLMLIALMMLIPNDHCANPFNYWWIKTIGASPLMYVPNMYAALFVTCGLYGVHPRATGVLTTCICVASLLLGIGHQLGIIW